MLKIEILFFFLNFTQPVFNIKPNISRILIQTLIFLYGSSHRTEPLPKFWWFAALMYTHLNVGVVAVRLGGQVALRQIGPGVALDQILELGILGTLQATRAIAHENYNRLGILKKLCQRQLLGSGID